jgi:hypothetical protein
MELIVWGGAAAGRTPDGEPRGREGWAPLLTEFPTVRITRGEGEPPREVLHVEDWESPVFDFWSFDRGLDLLAERGRPLALAAPAERLPRFAGEVLTRAQRLFDRRNAASATPLFDRALALHRELHATHDLGRPLVRADYDHSLDVWQWLLRLAPEAGLAVQLAALFHDAERLLAEADRRVEPVAGTAGAYRRFKDAHAERGARLADAVLSRAGFAPDLRGRVADLVAGHEGGQTAADPEAALLSDADSLSFFSLNSPGYLRYFGPEPTARKVAFTLGRMSPAARARLRDVRLPPEIAGRVAA